MIYRAEWCFFSFSMDLILSCWRVDICSPRTQIVEFVMIFLRFPRTQLVGWRHVLKTLEVDI